MVYCEVVPHDMSIRHFLVDVRTHILCSKCQNIKLSFKNIQKIKCKIPSCINFLNQGIFTSHFGFL